MTIILAIVLKKVGIFKVSKNKLLIFILVFIIAIMHIKVLERNYENKIVNIPVELNARVLVLSDGIDKEYKYTYLVKVIGTDIKLNMNLNKNKSKQNIPKFGDIVEISAIYELPKTARNYKGFDYKNYLKTKKIHGSIECEEYNVLQSNKESKINTAIHAVQNNLKGNIQKILEKEQGALCVGILIGDRENISSETEDSFKNSNLTHMLAVSGSHITYIIVAITTVIGKANKRYANIFTIFILIFFMALTGFTASVMRASIMGILTLLASILYRKSDTVNNLGISTLVLLIYNPYFLLDAGFLLSYAGTMGIIFFSDKINKSMEKLILKENNNQKNKMSNVKTIIKTILKAVINSFSITIAANLLIIPIMAYMFNTISLTFWISNILAGPIMEVVTIFGFIVYFVSILFPVIAEFLGIFLNFFLTLLLQIAKISSNIPGAFIYVKTPSILTCCVYYILLFSNTLFQDLKRQTIFIKSITYVKKYKYKIICIVVLISISSFIIDFIPSNLNIYFIDVGQGDSTLIKTVQNKTILIDGGGSEFGSFDVGKNTLLPYLLDRGISKIDYLMVSHFDSDHVGGLFAILENLKVENIIISRQGEESENFTEFMGLVNEKNINLIIVKKGDFIYIDRYSYFEILFPEEEYIRENILNNNSIVAKFTSKNTSMLFTGDIEETSEDRLCELYGTTNKLEADILKVAHHGSKTSSTEDFLGLVNPKIVLIGVSEGNNFGHPNSNVIERLKKYTNLIYRTDKNGEIEIKINNNEVEVNTMLNEK